MDANKESEDPLLKALDKLGEAEIPSHWCAIPELSKANWTNEEIQNVSSAGSCAKYDYDYSHLAEIGFEESLKYVEAHHETVKTVDCTEYNYADDVERKSMVEEWNLVCKRAPQRATIHMALSLGKLVGAGLLGVSADKYGRRTIYALGIIMFVVAGPVSAYIPWYWAFIILRLITGISFSAIQFSSLTTLTEVAGNTHRQWMAIAFNCGFASGSIFVAGISYLTSEWRQVQVATSLPALVLLLFMWYMPESPRWLISQGRRKQARVILEKFHGPIIEDPRVLSIPTDSRTIQVNEVVPDKEKESTNLIADQMRGLKIIFSHCELIKRASISYFAWMTASLTYYALALNVDNISVNYYYYAVLLGITEIPAYLIPTPILMVMGRRVASSILFIISGLLLLAILCISRTETVLIVTISLIGRFSLSAAYGIIILYTSEFFPTISRNSALGTSSAMAHVGSIIAPYSVDNLGALAWWAPSTLCGSLALLAGIACFALPETRNRPLADTVEEEVAHGRGNVSFNKSCKCVR